MLSKVIGVFSNAPEKERKKKQVLRKFSLFKLHVDVLCRRDCSPNLQPFLQNFLQNALNLQYGVISLGLNGWGGWGSPS